MNRKVLWAVLVIGAALVIAPFALSLPSKSGAGERMLSDFQPIMQPDQVQTTAYYYNDVFTPLGQVVPAMSAKNVAKFQRYVAGLKSVQLTPADMAKLQQQFPQLAAMFAGMPVMLRDFDSLVTLMQKNEKIFAQVPAGLVHYKPLVTAMQSNVTDYKQVNSLPSFRLFTWFFVVPGALLVLLAGTGLFGGRILSEPRLSHHTRPTHA
jgi:hypothetical protein